ncbi:Gfo/Idh/MocA family oxidoreductase [uncultured Cohaesibacter sp.]|uniref:Gfo/Idh/MocA family protein n=1 Tax=uncultured Cohaesibacter sp. TaxID=1002546 RepID=UPI0029C732FC|nr:Gfo/Idh/MocA family oxidoreductase [uncultured Cohaesibacter sp.]
MTNTELSSIVNTDPEKPANPRPIVSIGTGGIVTDAHLPAYRMAGYKVAGCFDLNGAKAAQVAKDWGIERSFDKLDELIAFGEEQGAIFDVAVPASEIAGIIRQLPEKSGVLIQKPMGESIGEAQTILKTCRDKKLTAGINFQLRRAPFMVAAKQMIDAGLLGDIHDVEMRVVCQTPWNLWSFLFEKERMEVNYHSIHYIDAVRFFLGDPQAVYSKTMKHPKMMELAQTRSAIIMDYGDVVRANISTNHGHDYAPDEQECFFKIEGTKGAIKIQIGVILNYPKGSVDKFRYVLDDGKGWQELDISGSWFPEAFMGPMGGLQKKMEDPDYAFANSIEDAYKTMCVVEACYGSSANGATKVDYGF